jgi:flagellar biosynthetic protein FlhB
LLVFKRLFSLDGFFAISKTLLKFALVIGVFWLTLSDEWTRLWALPVASSAESFRAAVSMLLRGLLAVVGALAVIAIADSGWQWWRYRARHAMTWRMLGRQQAAAAQSAQQSPRLIDEVIE